MASAFSTPFDSTLDAILHYYPLDSGRHHHLDTIHETTSTSTSSCDQLTITPTPSPVPDLRPLDLPLPYVNPNSDISPSRFSPARIHSKMPLAHVQQPEPRRAVALPKTIINPTNTRRSMDISPNRLSAPRASRGGASPSRSPHHGLTALSPLQGISPMQPMSLPKPRSGSSTPVKPASLGRIPSRRQSMVQSAADWREAGIENEGVQVGSAQSSRLILCKAPKEDDGLFGKTRSKSSSALAPFTAASHEFSVSPTSDRGPRRSFAAPLFSSLKPLHTRTPSSGNVTDTSNRLFDRSSKPMSPDDIYEIANSLKSPVAIPEGGFKGAELKRRKSSGARRSSSSHSLAAAAEEPKPPLALEPVEYVQMNEDVLLPFVERPEEVEELLAHENNRKWVSELKAAFPKDKAREHWQALSPEVWSWEEFMRHLHLPRSQCPDYQFIFRARQACRKRSIAHWEKLGTCLGCDGDLLNAGGDDGLPSTWGISTDTDDEDDDDDYQLRNQVWIEGLEAVDPEERERAERDFAGAFGSIQPDSPAMGLGMMGAIGEDEDEEELPSHPTPAQRAGNQASIDPFQSQGHSPLPTSLALGTSPSHKSHTYVGLQIMTSPRLGPGSPTSPRQSLSRSLSQSKVYVHERSAGDPLFVSHFGGLSIHPTLGRPEAVAPSVQTKGTGVPISAGEGRKWGLNRKSSGAGLSESAITFESESDYGPVHDEGVRR